VIYLQRKAVSSRRVRSIGWENNTLEVEFKNGDIYHYFNLPEWEYNAIMSSSSKGSEISRIDKIYLYRPIG